MNNVLFDTNIYLYHYRKYPPVVDAINAELNKGAVILLSVVQISELLSTTAVDHDETIRTDMESYISAVHRVVDVTEGIARKAAENIARNLLLSGMDVETVAQHIDLSRE
ncbi:MAG: type II toxin-antitoxin system VapC family toxin [Bacilli bacterium]